MTTGLKEAILEFFSWESLGAGSDAGQAGLLCRAAGASQPLAKKSVLQSSPHGRTGIFFLGRIPTLGLAGLRCPGAAGRLCEAGMWRARRWASPYSLGEPSNKVGASHQTRLGEPVLRGRWASPYSLGEPVGRASSHWASQLLQWPPQWPTPAPAWRSYGARSAPGARSALCLLGTFS